MSKYELMTVSGVTGSGKTSVIRNLLENYPDLFGIHPSITSRPPGNNDLDGEYIHLTKEEILRLDKNCELLWMDKYGDNYYATSKEDNYRERKASYTSIMTLTPKTVDLLYNLVPNDSILSVFIETPSEEELKRRFQERGRLSQEQIESRMKQNELWELKARKSSVPYRFVRNPRNGLDLAAARIREYFG